MGGFYRPEYSPVKGSETLLIHMVLLVWKVLPACFVCMDRSVVSGVSVSFVANMGTKMWVGIKSYG